MRTVAEHLECRICENHVSERGNPGHTHQRLNALQPSLSTSPRTYLFFCRWRGVLVLLDDADGIQAVQRQRVQEGGGLVSVSACYGDWPGVLMPVLSGEAGCGARRRSLHFYICRDDGGRLSGPRGCIIATGLTRGLLRCL